MNGPINDLEGEIIDRIRNHDAENPLHPTIRHEMNQYPDEIIVDYFVDLPQSERANYSHNFFDADQVWVEQRGDQLNLTATLLCEWQN